MDIILNYISGPVALMYSQGPLEEGGMDKNKKSIKVLRIIQQKIIDLYKDLYK